MPSVGSGDRTIKTKFNTIRPDASCARRAEVSTMRRQLTGLWQHTDFVRLWVGSTVSGIGSQITFLALPLAAVLTLDATPLQMGLLAAAGSIPALIFGLGTGVWVDRVKKRPVMILADYGRALLICTIPVAAIFQLLNIWHLYFVALAMGTFNMLFAVASRSMIPALVGRDELVEANSKLEIGRSAAQVVGPGIAGILIRVLGAPIALVVDAVTFVVSSVAVQTIRTPEPEAAPSTGETSFIREAMVGLRLIARSQVLLPIAAVVAGLSIFNAMFESVWLLYVSQSLGIGPLAFGTMFSVSSVGFLAGAFVSAKVIRWAGAGRALVLGVVVLGLTDMATPLVGGPVIVTTVILTTAMFFFGIGATIYNVSQVSMRQAYTPLRLQGRVHGAMNTLEVGLVPIGALIGGVMGEVIGLRPTLFIGAAGEMLGIIWLVFTPVWRLRDLPASPEDDAEDQIRS